jgi:hypothetical protein
MYSSSTSPVAGLFNATVDCLYRKRPEARDIPPEAIRREAAEIV